MIGIYKITSPSSKVYIGQSWDIDKRKKDHRNDFKRKNTALANSIKKYGFANHLFEVIHELPIDIEQKVLDRYEQLYIDSYRDCSIKLMNSKEATSRGKCSDELKKKMSITKQGMGKGRKQSDEWKAKRNLFKKGNNVWLGKKHNEETKQKQRLAAIGKPKLSIRKPIIQLTDDLKFIKEWSSIKYAANELGLFSQGIGQVCKGRCSQCGGFKWVYKSDYQSMNN